MTQPVLFARNNLTECASVNRRKMEGRDQALLTRISNHYFSSIGSSNELIADVLMPTNAVTPIPNKY